MQAQGRQEKNFSFPPNMYCLSPPAASQHSCSIFTGISGKTDLWVETKVTTSALAQLACGLKPDVAVTADYLSYL